MLTTEPTNLTNLPDPLERIRLQMPSLSKTHRKIGEYLLNHYDKAIFLSLAKMSQRCEVSEASVVRFAVALGYSGYSEMQQELQELLKRQITLTQRLVEITENTESGTEVFHNVVQKSIEGISRLHSAVDENNFLAAVDLLANCERVFLIGSRSSYGAAHFLGLNLGWIRRSVFVINGEGHEFDALSSLTPKDVVLAISLPHYLRSTVNALEFAFQKKACTICITDTLSSPIVQFSAVPLLVHNEILSYSDNIVPVICLITALLNAVGASRREESEQILEERETFWRNAGIHARLN